MQQQVQISSERFEELAREGKRDLFRKNLFYFVHKSKLKMDGNPFSFDGHEYLREPYQAAGDPSIREVIDMKAAQMGLSTKEILNAFHGIWGGRYPKGVLYLLPSKTDVTEFSKGKVQGIIDENKVIADWVGSTDSSRNTDAANIKRIGQGLIYFRGMQSRVGLKTISIDLTIFDEIEEVEDWEMVELAERRMDHSEVNFLGNIIRGGFIHRLSVPSVPGYGIDSYFSGRMSDDNSGWLIQPSDQRYWNIKCEHCNTENCLEDEFPDCIVEVNYKEQTAIRVCKKCRRELNIANGVWVAKEPDRKKRGYHFSQLFSHYINPWNLLDQFRRKHNIVTLFNDKLGIPYIETDARLETQEVLSLCGTLPQLDSFSGPASMGVDQPKEEGGKFHVVIAYRDGKVPCSIIRICVREKWSELADLMKRYNVARCVVDALPDQAKARSFADEFRGKVYMIFYSEKQRGSYRWNDDQLTVSVDRTETLNSSTRAVHEKEVLLPRKDDDTIQFAKHCHNIARKSEEDKDTQVVRHIWKRTGADHYRHAFNYLWIGLTEIGQYYQPRDDRDWKRDRQKPLDWRLV